MQLQSLAYIGELVRRQAGGIPGINRFINGKNEAVWISVYVAFILWLLSLLIAPAMHNFGKNKPVGRLGGLSGIANRFARAARDTFLIVLVTVLVNQSGHGVSGGIVALQWIVTALLVLWTLVEAFAPQLWWLDMLLFLGAMVLQIISFALAFRNAPSE
ncbi:hypothetical protein HDU85_005025 [Gaertneriomyces sp. JEL0708]|nr:hypothetical protein HDU85_005025 [Gaertneriomyces sp. JEL0708]